MWPSHYSSDQKVLGSDPDFRLCCREPVLVTQNFIITESWPWWAGDEEAVVSIPPGSSYIIS